MCTTRLSAIHGSCHKKSAEEECQPHYSGPMSRGKQALHTHPGYSDPPQVLTLRTHPQKVADTNDTHPLKTLPRCRVYEEHNIMTDMKIVL